MDPGFIMGTISTGPESDLGILNTRDLTQNLGLLNGQWTQDLQLGMAVCNFLLILNF